MFIYGPRVIFQGRLLGAYRFCLRVACFAKALQPSMAYLGEIHITGILNRFIE